MERLVASSALVRATESCDGRLMVFPTAPRWFHSIFFSFLLTMSALLPKQTFFGLDFLLHFFFPETNWRSVPLIASPPLPGLFPDLQAFARAPSVFLFIDIICLQVRAVPRFVRSNFHILVCPPSRPSLYSIIFSILLRSLTRLP